MQRGLVDDVSRKDGIAILHVGDSKPVEPLGPAPIEVPFYPDLINGHPSSFHLPSRYFGCGLRAIILPRTRVNRGPSRRGMLLDHTRPPSRAVSTTWRMASTTSSGWSNWMQWALFFATTSLLFLERSVRPASNSVNCSSTRFASPFAKPGNWRAPALRMINGFSPSEGAASATSATLSFMVADSSNAA